MYRAVIVDDEALIVDGLIEAIDWSGFNIEIAFATTDPATAYHYILSNPVNIVITDVMMPEMSGLSLIQKIKKEKPSVYVIILSAYDKFEYARQALRYGAENYLLKPLDPDELSDTVSQIISHMQEREQLSSIYGNSMMTFRSSFTEQWVRNQLSGSEFSNRAELLGINLNLQNYTVVIFSCSGDSSGMSQFFELFLASLPGRFLANFFFETPSRLVCVLTPPGGRYASNLLDMQSFLNSILANASAHGLKVFASAGSCVSTSSEVHLSFEQADMFSFLEYSSLPYIFYRHAPKLSGAVKAALISYENSEGGDFSAIAQLYQIYQADLCTWHILSARILRLCKRMHELPEKYPEIIRLLASFPAISPRDPESRKIYMTYTRHFLASTDPLLFSADQSMYPVIDSVIKSVNNFSDKNLSLKTLAAKYNVSPSYLGTLFRQQTGYFFNDYLKNARLKHAAELLEDTDIKIKDIVDKVGFSSQTYFNRSFKQYYGTTPVNYRRDKNLHLTE